MSVLDDVFGEDKPTKKRSPESLRASQNAAYASQEAEDLLRDPTFAERMAGTAQGAADFFSMGAAPAVAGFARMAGNLANRGADPLNDYREGYDAQTAATDAAKERVPQSYAVGELAPQVLPLADMGARGLKAAADVGIDRLGKRLAGDVPVAAESAPGIISRLAADPAVRTQAGNVVDNLPIVGPFVKAGKDLAGAVRTVRKAANPVAPLVDDYAVPANALDDIPRAPALGESPPVAADPLEAMARPMPKALPPDMPAPPAEVGVPADPLEVLVRPPQIPPGFRVNPDVADFSPRRAAKITRAIEARASAKAAKAAAPDPWTAPLVTPRSAPPDAFRAAVQALDNQVELYMPAELPGYAEALARSMGLPAGSGQAVLAAQRAAKAARWQEALMSPPRGAQ